MLVQILTIVAPVFFLALVGFTWARLGYEYPSEFIARLVMNVAAPCLLLATMTTSGISLAAMAEVALSTVLILLGMYLIGGLAIRRLGIARGVYLPPLMFPNSGNMGLSLCLYAFGDVGLALALGVFMTLTVAQFTIGTLIASGASERPLQRMLRLVREPVVVASVVSVLCLAFDLQLPQWAYKAVSLLGSVTIPLMLVTLGVSLAQLSVRNLRPALLMALTRLGAGFVLGLLVAELLGFEGVARGVVVLQASMPAAVFNYLLAVRYGQSPADTAGVVVLSTLLSFITLPLVLAHLL